MKSLGFISVGALVFSLFVVQLIWGPDRNKTFSRLVAQKKSSTIAYFVIFVVWLSAFGAFMFDWFIPELDMPASFSIALAMGALGQLIAVSIPETKGIKEKIHLVGAGLMTVSLFVQSIIIWLHLGQGRAVNGTLTLIMAAILLLVVTKHKIIKEELALQSVYSACYLLVIINSTYFL